MEAVEHLRRSLTRASWPGAFSRGMLVMDGSFRPPVLETGRALLNFVVVGDTRSGAAVVQSAIQHRTDALCHGDLFHPDAAVRQAVYHAHFSADALGQPFQPGEDHPVSYLQRYVFDHAEHDERAVGLRLSYPLIRDYELWDLFAARHHEGDFCLVHVLRNPVACFVSLKQAQASGVWAWTGATRRPLIPAAVVVDPDELTQFCRNSLNTRERLRRAVTDALEVTYWTLFTDFQAALAKVFEFLELPDRDEPAVSDYRRLGNRLMRSRISGFDDLRRRVPEDIRYLLDAEDLF